MKFKQGDIVIYKPTEEEGIVNSISINDLYVFVRFMKQINKFGYDGTTSQGCDPDDLILKSEYLNEKNNGCCGKSCDCGQESC